MYRFTLPYTENSLQIFPRWAEWSLGWQLFLLFICLLPFALVLWLYRYELRLVALPVALALLGLRVVVILLLLLVITLQPVAARPIVEEKPGRILIAVDRSGSMDIPDPQRPPKDKLRLARAFQMARDICSDLQLDEWIKQYEAGGTPRWVGDDEYLDDGDRRRKLAEERRRQHDQVCQRVDALTRTQLGQRILNDDGLRLLTTLGNRYTLELVGFNRDTWDVPLDRKDDLYLAAKKDEREPKPKSAEDTLPDTAFTNLSPPLGRALDRMGSEQARLRAVLLLTDGQHTGKEVDEILLRAARLRKQDVPVYPLALGDATAPPDVTLVSIKAPEVVFKEKDIEVPIEVQVRVSGPVDQEIVVELQRPGEPPIEKRLRPKKPGTYPLTFLTELNQEGTQQLKVAVKPVQGETSTENNSRTTYVKVVDDRAKVLLVDGEPRWEYHYLATALARDKQVKLDRVVFHQPRINKIPEDELERSGNPAKKMPEGPEALLGYDIIILGDIAPEQLPPAERQRLEQYVAARGGSLVIVAGKQHMPLSYRDVSRPAKEQEDPILKLLPIEEPRAVQSKQGFALTLTTEGRVSPFLLIDDTPEESEQRWQEFPPHHWAVVGRAKPGARPPLAFYPGEQPSRDPKELAQQEKEQSLVVQQAYGRGQVLFVGLDSTWRWRYKAGDKYHHRFWGQLVRWASSDKLLEGGNRFVRFGTGKPMYEPGQEIDVVVRLGEDVKLKPDTPARAKLFKVVGEKEEAVAVVPLAPREGHPRVLEGRVKDLPPGDYRVEPDIPDLADKLREPPGVESPKAGQARFQISPPDNQELVELAMNRKLLDAVAAESGGRVFTADEVPQLIQRLTQEASRREKPVENKLWQWWPLLVLLMVLLTLEWAGRKWAGLP